MVNQSIIRAKLNQYNSRINIMNMLCTRCAGYFNKLKNIITLLLVILSSGVAITNAIFRDSKDERLRITTIIIEFFITFLIAFERSFKIGDKANNFGKYADNFRKLSHDIEKNLETDIDNDFLDKIITLYDNIYDGINEAFPSFILNKMKEEYENIKSHHLPMCFGRYDILSPDFQPADGTGQISPLAKDSSFGSSFNSKRNLRFPSQSPPSRPMSTIVYANNNRVL